MPTRNPAAHHGDRSRSPRNSNTSVRTGRTPPGGGGHPGTNRSAGPDRGRRAPATSREPGSTTWSPYTPDVQPAPGQIFEGPATLRVQLTVGGRRHTRRGHHEVVPRRQGDGSIFGEFTEDGTETTADAVADDGWTQSPGRRVGQTRHSDVSGGGVAHGHEIRPPTRRGTAECSEALPAMNAAYQTDSRFLPLSRRRRMRARPPRVAIRLRNPWRRALRRTLG